MRKLLAHLEAMQIMATAYICPLQYRDRNGLAAINHDEANKLFANDMVYMLDGPEQREAYKGLAGQGLDQCFELTRRLHRQFNTPAPDMPAMQLQFFVDRRARWIDSETQELRDATTLVDQADAYLDVIVFALGGLVELGVAPGNLYEIIMRSQFAKVWADGQAHFASDGKWLKPEGWIAPEPELEAEVGRQVALGGFKTQAERDNFEADMGAGDYVDKIAPPVK